MKKIKIMLLSLALFAVVGGALAFKAKFNKTYCTTTAASINGVWTCRVGAANLDCFTTTAPSTTDPSPLAVQKLCTTDPIVINDVETCFDENSVPLKCPIRTSLIHD